MAKHANSKSGFVIKLSEETVQKLVDEEHQARAAATACNPALLVPDKIEENAHCTVENISENSSEIVEVTYDSSLALVKEEKNVNTNVVSTISIDNKETHEVSDMVNMTDNSNSESECVKNKCNVENTEKSIDSSVESNASWGEYAPYIKYEGAEAIYTDPTTNQKYLWSETSNSWETKSDSQVPGKVYTYEDDTHIYTEADGSKYFWDVEKKAWIPKVDDDFLAFYQMSYGFVDNKTEDKKDENKDSQKKTEPVGVKRKNEPQWFEPSEQTNTKVYVSNLPLDMTEEEFVDLMQKCGLVERDPSTQKMKVKLYMDKEHKCFKGDALCTYIKIESVDLALKLIDGSDCKGNTIKVERAHFQLKGEYNPALKPKKKKKKELEKIKKMQQKLFDWRPEKFIGERSKHERVVIVKNLFHPSDFDKDVQLILDYQQDLREECGKSGEVRKVVIYDGHPEGVAQITMKEPEQADAVVQLINGRWFGKRQITAEIWDGRTKYKIAETDADLNKRIEKWDKFLDKVDEDKECGNKSSDKNKDTSTVIANSEGKEVHKDACTDKNSEKNVAKDESINDHNLQKKEFHKVASTDENSKKNVARDASIDENNTEKNIGHKDANTVENKEKNEIAVGTMECDD